MRKKEGSTNQRQNGNNNHSQEGGAKRVPGDMEWYKLLNENNGYKIMEGEQCKWHTQG